MIFLLVQFHYFLFGYLIFFFFKNIFRITDKEEIVESTIKPIKELLDIGFIPVNNIYK